MRLVRIQRPEPFRGRRLRQDTSPSSWETRVQIPSAAPICARSKTGQCAGLRIRAVEVRVLPCAPIHQGVGEPGRPCLPWKQETGGSNPPALTISCPLAQLVERRSLKADVRGSSPRRAANRPDARVARERSAKAPTPVQFRLWSPSSSGSSGEAPIFKIGRCWFESSLEHYFTRRVNWAGAQRRLLSDRPARR